MKAMIGLGDIKELLKSSKGIKAALIVGAVLIMFIAFGDVFTGSRSKETIKQINTADQLAEYENRLEQRLTDILSQIDGVGNVRVMVTLDTSGQTEYGRNSDMLLSVTAPEVRGVIVVCDGGDSAAVKAKVYDAVSGVFGINSLHISVTRCCTYKEET